MCEPLGWRSWLVLELFLHSSIVGCELLCSARCFSLSLSFLSLVLTFSLTHSVTICYLVLHEDKMSNLSVGEFCSR